MSDFEMMCAMYGRAGIEYEIKTNGNYYHSENWHNAICLVADKDTVMGYDGFTCDHVFDKDGHLMDVYIWE